MPGTERPLAPLEIACDESGFTGTSLAEHGTVFCHASLLVEPAAADDLVARVRAETGSTTGELKAQRLFRPRARPALRRLLDPLAGLPDRAYVQLTDTRRFLLARILEVLLDDDAPSALDLPGRREPARTMVATLAAGGPIWFGEPGWRRFLRRGADVLRLGGRHTSPYALERFGEALDDLRHRPAPATARTVLDLLDAERAIGRLGDRARSRAWPRPLLEPLIPAVARAALHWAPPGGELRVVHDEQSVLTPGRIGELAAGLRADRPGTRLALVRVDSALDARVQLADLVAGIARRAAAGVLLGKPDPELVALVEPLIAPGGSLTGGDGLTGDDGASQTLRVPPGRTHPAGRD